MRRIALILSLAIAAVHTSSAEAAPERKLRVFLFAGQSNMEGKGDGAKLTAGERARLERAGQRVRIAYNHSGIVPLDVVPASEGNRRRFKVESTFGPELFFGLRLAEEWPDDEFLFIKRSVGATSLYGRWNPDWSAEKAAVFGEEDAPPLYADFSGYVREVLAALDPAEYEICGMVWVQGEADGNTSRAGTVPGQAYAQNLANLVNRVRSDTGARDLPFVLLEVGSPTVVNGMRTTTAALPNMALVPQSKDGSSPFFYPKHEVGHYNYEGMKRIGLNLAAAYLENFGSRLHPSSSAEELPEPDRVVIYKSTPERQLRARIFLPPGWSASDRRPAIVFWCGGAFRGGISPQFFVQAKYLASRGMVAIHADYRGTKIDGVPLSRCVEDARSSVRWVKSHASELGIDPSRLAGSGGSAGGALALFTTWTDVPDAIGDDLAVSPRPSALVLFNPAMGDSLIPEIKPADPDESGLYSLLVGLSSPSADAPPSIMFYGTLDAAYLEESRTYAREVALNGVRSEVWTADGMGHGFFNRSPWREVTLRKTDEFLVSLGYIQGEANLAVPPGAVLKKAGGS